MSWERACAQTSPRLSGSLIAEACPWVFHEDLGYLSVSFGLDEECLSTTTKLHYSKVFGSKQQVKGGQPPPLLSSGEVIPRALYPGLSIFSTKHRWELLERAQQKAKNDPKNQKIILSDEERLRELWLLSLQKRRLPVPINLCKYLNRACSVCSASKQGLPMFEIMNWPQEILKRTKSTKLR